jgi:hypothetical protein
MGRILVASGIFGKALPPYNIRHVELCNRAMVLLGGQYRLQRSEMFALRCAI